MKLTKCAKEIESRTMSHPSFGSVTLVARRPSWKELLEVQAALGDRKALPEALLSVLVNWTGVEDDRGPMPFSPTNFQAACCQYPALFLQAVRFCDDVFYPPNQRAELGNSEPPSSVAADIQPSPDGTC